MKKLITTMAVVLVAASVAQADTIAAWDMTGIAARTASAPATTEGSGISAGSFAIGPGLVAVDWPDAVGSFADWQISTSIEYALGAGNDYFSFTVTPDAGKTASYSNIFTRFVVNAGGTDTSMNFALLSSQTGFTTNDVLGSFNTVAIAADTQYNPVAFTTDFDLSGEAALQGVATATEFRIYAWKDNGGNRIGIGHTWGNGSGDDLRVDGTVIPEPGTLGLLGFAAAGMFWFRKRFSR